MHLSFLAPGKNLVPDNLDLSSVTRPRTSKLLSKVETVNGEKYVWCTFSEDQVDYDFENSEVLKEFISIISFYLDNGISVFRFDAVAFLWKKVGSSCVNLPETHEIPRAIGVVVTVTLAFITGSVAASILAEVLYLCSATCSDTIIPP